MVHFAPRTFTYALIVGGLLTTTVAVAETQAATTTTLQAQQTTPDADIAAKIRKELTDDKALSGYATTLKIIVSDGLVSLKGAVRSDADKKAIEQKAAKVVGEANVMNNLFISTADAKAPTN